MPTLAQLNEKRKERKQLCDQAGAILSVAANANRAIRPDELAKWDKLHAEARRLWEKFIVPWEQEMEREQASEMRAYTLDGKPDFRMAGREETRGGESIPAGGYGDVGDEPPARDPALGRCFRQWMRGGDGALSDDDRRIVHEARSRRLEERTRGMSPEMLEMERRALAAGTGSAGGYTVPQDFEYKLDIAMKAYGGIFEAAEIIPTTDGRLLPYPSANDTGNTGESTAENAAVGGSGIAGAPAEVDPNFAVTNFSAYMKDSGIVLAPVQLIEDGAFDIEKLLISMLKVRLGRLINSLATISGAGGGQDITPILTAATLGVTATTSVTITYNNLIDLYHSVDPLYRVPSRDNGTCWMFHDSTLQAVKKLVDSNNRPLFIAGGVSEGIQNNNPDTLLGCPFIINQSMPTINAANKSVLFGAMKKYKLRRVREVQLVRFGERYMTQLAVGFLAFLRVDGNLVDAGTHPVKYLAQSPT